MLNQLISFFSSFALPMILHVVGVGEFPKPLSAKEEKKQIELFQSGSKEARDTLIEHNLRLVAHIAKKYSNTGVENDDLVSIGTIGLIKGIDSYDPERKIHLSSYVSRCIENEILMHLRSRRKSALDISMDETIDIDKDGNALTLKEILADNEDIADETEIKLLSEKLKRHIQFIPEREKQILIMRFGLSGDDPLTQREIAKKLNISRSYVSRIEKKALDRLSSFSFTHEVTMK